MGPKKGKELQSENYWRTRIEDARLDEENWTVKVIIMDGAGSDQDRIYLSKFETFAAEERRFVIKNICRTETIFMINQLGGEKKVKDDNLRVFEEGQAYLKDKKDIPSDILALIIKHLILKMKEEYLFIKRQKLEVKEGMRRESLTMIDRAEVRGTIIKPPEPVEPPATKGKGKKGAEPVSQMPVPDEGKKYNTSLRIRGEEWRDKVYVDDFPVDGPNLYVSITGFGDPLLPVCLVKIGIPLTSVVQIRIDAVSTKVPSTLFRATKRGQSQTEMLAEKSNKFWEDLQQLRIHRDTADQFKNTAFVIFSPPYWDTEQLSGSPDKIYDEMCYLMYDLQDLTRQHVHFLDNMHIIHVPDETEDEHIKKYYQLLMGDLPLECVTTFSVLDSILQTVCKNEMVENSSRSSLSTAITLNQPHITASTDNKIENAENFVTEVFNRLCKTETNKKSYRLTYGKEYENHKDPIVINYGDLAKRSTFHLGNINLDNIVWSTLLGMPIHRLWLNQDRPQGELEAKINFHVNVLLSSFERQDVETAELKRLIHILACRKLFNNRSSLKKHHLPLSTITEFKKIYLKRSILAEPLSTCPSLFRSCSIASPSFPSMTKSENISDISAGEDPESHRIKFLFDCPDISELVSAAEIANQQPINHIIDDFEFFEDFKGISAFQIMLEAFNKFNCLDYKYCEVTDCFILMFYNSHDKDGIAREEWRCHLPTPLCLQDYFDFVLDEHYNWIQNEEKIYDEKMAVKSKSESKLLIDPFAGVSCIENTDVEMELLMEGSLKYQDIVQVEDSTPEMSDKAVSAKKTSPSSTDADTKSSRKTKSPLSSTPKNVKHQQYYMASRNPSDTSIEIPTKPFSGYDLGDRRVEVFGKDSTYFSKDGTLVSSFYTLIIPMNLEYIILNVVPGNSSNEFWIHRALGEYVAPEILDICESFRITSKDQVMINIRKQSYQIPLTDLNPAEIPKQKDSALKSGSLKSQPLSQTTQEMFETKSFHSLYITWPNGLITESVYEPNSANISHIKQYHNIPFPQINENMRCISLNGEVLVYKTDGNIEVLRPDGSYIKIIKYERRMVGSALVDDQSETSSEKSKKAKGKEKGKQSKTSSKSSKYLVVSDDEVPAVKPEFVLFIDEFETIETSGLRQKWVNDIPYDIEKLLIRTATDHCLGEVFSRRMDGTNILINKNGTQVVTFPNNTRIITTFVVEDFEIYPEWTEEEKQFLEMIDSDIEITTTKSKASSSQKSYVFNGSVSSSMSRKFEEEETKEKDKNDGYVSVQIVYTIEHEHFATVTINKANGKISVDSPNNTIVTIDTNNHYEITLDSRTSAKFDGENLHINYEACPKCRSYTTCDVAIRRKEPTSEDKAQQHWLKMKDSFCKKIVVNDEGNISILDEQSQETLPVADEVTHVEMNIENLDDLKPPDGKFDVKSEGKSESSLTSHSKCREMYQAKTMRFFILQRDLTCSELIHRALVDQYKLACRWQPWCTTNRYDTFGDHRSLLSILTPINLTETEKWLMNSKLANKPTFLTYKDLKKDCGKGFYHWMRPYERFEPKPLKPECVLPPRLPRAFVLRTLEEQWGESDRDQLKGAKELLTAILRYRVIMSEDCETMLNIPIIDLRAEDERQTDEIIQALAHRIYEDLKTRLNNDVQSRAKATITTTPAPEPEQISLEGEIEGEDDTNDLKALEEERASLVKEVEEAEEMSPNLKRYWRRRAEERKEEEFYLYLLREGNVPPYFRNVLGGAIWWEMNDAAGEAVTKAERRKMKCVCAGEEATSRTNDSFIPPFI